MGNSAADEASRGAALHAGGSPLPASCFSPGSRISFSHSYVPSQPPMALAMR